MLRSGRNNRLPVTWKIGVVRSGSGSLLKIVSLGGQFKLPGGQLIGNNPMVLQKPGVAGPVNLAEQITIPIGVVNKVLQTGNNILSYCRTFTDGLNNV
ncbi:MAG: hypothetical protein ACI8P9_000738 [Parasphingorhabdus sp.]